jgi:hypothetical protein
VKVSRATIFASIEGFFSGRHHVRVLRHHLIEFHELARCPQTLKAGVTDFLGALIARQDLYGPVRPMLADAIAKSGSAQVVDMCSGGGGPWLSWRRGAALGCRVILTDKFPNATLIARLEREPVSGLDYYEHPVDADDPGEHISGFRTFFSAFHHFEPDRARHIIHHAVMQRQPIAIFEFTYRHPAALLWMALSPFAVWLLTPAIRPLSASKLLFTYLVPVIPLLVAIDGIVSCFRTYTTEELLAIADAPDYVWQCGTKRSGTWPLPITYVIGYPRTGNDTGGARSARKSSTRSRSNQVQYAS